MSEEMTLDRLGYELSFWLLPDFHHCTRALMTNGTTMRPTLALFAALTNSPSLRTSPVRSLTSLSMAPSGDNLVVGE